MVQPIYDLHFNVTLFQLNTSMEYISQTAAFNPSGKYLILYNDPDERFNSDHLAFGVLNMMFISHHCVNVVFAFGIDITRYILYTGDPYHGDQKTCGNFELRA